MHGRHGQAAVRPVCALYLAERVFALMSHRRLVPTFACALLGAEPGAAAGGAAYPGLAPPALGRQRRGAPYRGAVLSALTATDCQLAGAALRLLFAVLQHADLGPELLDAVGLLPYRQRKRRDLFKSLTEEEKVCPEPQAHAACRPHQSQYTE